MRLLKYWTCESGEDNTDKNSSPVMENEVNNSEGPSTGSYLEPLK
jgi:hypothetical protein